MPSKVIRFYHYDEEQKILTIGFVSGSKYQYMDIPAEVYARFRGAYSKGHFFSQNIRDIYKYNKAPDE